ncbi:MAG: hypothetical protein ACK5LZ_06955 [Anaerorhabdus sp.]
MTKKVIKTMMALLLSLVAATYAPQQTFAAGQYTITATAGDNGVITPVGVTVVNGGSDMEYVITTQKNISTNTAYEVDEILVDGVAIDMGEVTINETNTKVTYRYTFTNISANHTIDITFKKLVLTAYISAAKGGVISYQVIENAVTTMTGSVPVGEAYALEYPYGATLKITGIANSGSSSDTSYAHTTNDPVSGSLRSSISNTPKQYYNLSQSTVDTSISYTFNTRYTIYTESNAGGQLSTPWYNTVYEGDDLIVRVTPNEGYIIAEVKINGESVEIKDTYTFSSVNANQSLYVTFAFASYDVELKAIPNGGYLEYALYDRDNKLLSEGQVNSGETIKLEAPYYSKVYVNSFLYLGGLALGKVEAYYKMTNKTTGDIMVEKRDNQISGVVFENIDYDVYTEFSFEPIYTLTASSGINGKISASGDVLVAKNGSKLFEFTPDAGYQIEDVLVDGVSVGAVESYEFTSVSADHTIEVTFSLIPVAEYVITAVSGSGGAISPSGDVVVLENGNQNYTIVADASYQIEDVLVDGVSVGAVESYEFTEVSDNHIIEAIFTEITYTVTIKSNELGTIEKVEPVKNFMTLTRQYSTMVLDVEETLNHGDSLEVRIEPESGNEVLLVTVNGESITNAVLSELNTASTYVIENVQSDMNIMVYFGEINKTVYHTVNFLDCAGNMVGQAWAISGESVEGPKGYHYGTDELNNIHYSKDINPINCSGNFSVPNTGKK